MCCHQPLLYSDVSDVDNGLDPDGNAPLTLWLGSEIDRHDMHLLIYSVGAEDLDDDQVLTTPAKHPIEVITIDDDNPKLSKVHRASEKVDLVSLARGPSCRRPLNPGTEASALLIPVQRHPAKTAPLRISGCSPEAYHRQD